MRWLDTLLQDLRYALRSIRRAPMLTAATVLTMALGIGLNASVFTTLDGFLFRARVSDDPASFIHLSPEYKSAAATREIPWSMSAIDYRAYVASAHSVRALAAWGIGRVSLGRDADTQLALFVTCNFFEVYGIKQPKIGRLFASDECATPGSGQAVVISEQIWKARFGGDPAVIGKTLRVNRTPLTVVGVLPDEFAGRLRGQGIWIPWTLQPALQSQDLFRDSSARWLIVDGRLRPGYSKSDARSEFAVIAARLDSISPNRMRRTTMSVTNGSFAEEPALRGSLFWMGPLIMGALTLILLIACTNVTVLQLSRAVTRQREMGIRLSIGASRGRVMRMLLTESILLATISGGISAYVSFQAPAIFARSLASQGTPVYQLRPDLTVLVYLGSIVLIAACLAGLTPAAESLRVNLADSMKSGTGSGATGTGSSGSSRRTFLVSAQVAMSMVLLVTAGLFIRAQYSILNSDPGFETKQVLAVPLRPELVAAVNRIRALPGVESVAMGTPFANGEAGENAGEVRLAGEEKQAGKPVGVSVVSAGFFETLRIPIVRGRGFLREEESPAPVAIVSQALARQFWPGKDPLGQTLFMGDGPELHVVGVARDVQSERAGAVDGPHLYRVRDARSTGDPLLVRFSGDAGRMTAAIRAVVTQVDPEMAVAPKTLRATLDEMADRFSAIVRMVGVLAFVAVSLAVLAIYGVVAFSVSQRTKELGIRMALGATGGRIVRSVVRSGAKPIAIGLGAGLAMAVLAARAVAMTLRQTPVALDPNSPLAFVVVGAMLLVVSVGAMLRPALRAASADPMKALRED